MKRVILLSGGLDSVAAAHWAIELGSAECKREGRSGHDVTAVGFDYGQPHRHAELCAAGEIAADLGVPFSVLRIVEIGSMRTDPGKGDSGVSKAFVPGRNGMFLWHAAAHVVNSGASRFGLVIGCNRDDAAGFPDCTHDFLCKAEASIRAGMSANVTIMSPWLMLSKRSIVWWASQRPDALRDIRRSVSCYNGSSCGKCDACTLRRGSFDRAKVLDGSPVSSVAFGGDPHRDAMFKS